jgi:LysR family transcriptional regulator, hypochlorite-specific transcription factor HypT
MHLEIRWIEDLIAIEQTQSLSRAAHLRCVSQPAFSRRIQQLEQQLGFEVLQRDAKHLHFTEAGLVLINSAKTISKQLNDTMALLHNMHKENNLTIRFAVAHSLTSQFFSHFLAFFPSNIAHFKIEMQATNVFEGMQLLKQGLCDFMLCYADQKLLQQTSHGLLQSVQFGSTDVIPVCLVNEQGQPKFDIHATFPLISYSPKAYLQQLVTHILTQHQLQARLLYETDNANNIKDLVLQGRGIAWLPRLTIEQELQKGLLAICDATFSYPQQDIFLLKLGLTQRESIEQLWQYVRLHTASA